MLTKTVSMRLLWESIKCYTDDFKNKKIFFFTLLDSINFLQKYFENFGQKFQIFFSNFVHCTLYTQKFLPEVVKCTVYKIWGKNLNFLNRISKIFWEEINWIRKKEFLFLKLCVQHCIDYQRNLIETVFLTFVGFHLK